VAITVQNSKAMVVHCLRMLLYGPLRTGKTSFIGTCPKPVVISVAPENGHLSLKMFNVDVIVIHSVAEMREAIQYIETFGKSKHNWETVGVDGITGYSDMFVQECTRNGEKAMDQRSWGLLDLHLQKWLLPKLHSLPFHIVWIANEEEIKDTNGNVSHYMPSLYGKSKTKFPGAIDLIVKSYVRTVRNPQTQKLETEYLFKTVSTDGSPVGGRFGTAFADGLIPMTFQEIAKRIGPWIAPVGIP
jgi:hypothetical protein